MARLGALADRLQRVNRGRKARWILRFVQVHDVRTVLMVGANGQFGAQSFENLVERRVAGGVEQVVWSSLPLTGDQPYVVCDGRALPFRDGSFDLVLSNAVIEHVGDEPDQQRLVDEHRRVGRTWIVTTPNRWFPVESHTLTVFRHWDPRWCERQASFTRLLSRRTFGRLTDGNVVGTPLSPTFIAWGSHSSRA